MKTRTLAFQGDLFESERLFQRGVESLGLSLTPFHLTAFRRYLEELKRWNRRINLTGFHSDEEIVLQGFLGSLAFTVAFPAREGLQAVDIGSGAGFPGLPLKIVFPSLHLTFIEASRKKVSFLKQMVRLLDLGDVVCLWARAEEVAKKPEHRERCDIAFARAVAGLEDQIRLALPFLKQGGILIVQKGKRGLEEMESLKKKEGALGVQIRRPVPLEIPPLPEERYLIIVERPSCFT